MSDDDPSEFYCAVRLIVHTFLSPRLLVFRTVELPLVAESEDDVDPAHMHTKNTRFDVQDHPHYAVLSSLRAATD